MNRQEILPQILLERYVLGELPKPQAKRLEAKLSEDLHLQARVAHIRQNNKTYLESHPTEVAYQAVSLSVETKNKPQISRPFLQFFLPGAVTIAFLAFLVLPQVTLFNGQKAYEDIVLDETSDIRLKGLEPQLNVYKKFNDELQKLGNKDLAKNNEIIQLSYVAGGMNYGAIFSIDGRGSVTLHFPENVNGSTRLNPEGEIPLEHAYQLDDAPVFERFFFVASNNEVNIPDILFAAQRLADRKTIFGTDRLELDDRIKQKTISVQKVEK